MSNLKIGDIIIRIEDKDTDIYSIGTIFLVKETPNEADKTCLVDVIKTIDFKTLAKGITIFHSNCKILEGRFYRLVLNV